MERSIEGRCAGMNRVRPFRSDGAPSARGAILDLDGTLIREGDVMPGAAGLLDHFAGRFVIASNNSTDTGESLSGRLAHLGLSVPPHRLVLAGQETLRLIAARHPRARIFLMASEVLTDHARALGLHPSSEDGDIVVLCRDTRFDYTKLRGAGDLLRRGAPFFVANPDLTHPGADGTQVPETGALLAAITACAGPVRSTIIGKPQSHLYTVALARLALAPYEAVMIGDNPETDAAGAKALGMSSLLIGAHRDAVARDPSTLLDRLIG